MRGTTGVSCTSGSAGRSEALSDFNKALELDDLNGQAYNNRGLVYLKLGKNNEAIEDLKKAGRLGVPEAVGVPQVKRDLVCPTAPVRDCPFLWLLRL